MASKRVILSSLVVLALAAAAFVQTGHGAGEAVEAGGGSTAFARASGTRFTLGGRPFYSNGFNAYWLMYMASDPADRSKAAAALKEAARLGATLVRTWAFSDGGYRALQVSPGVYNEEVFRVCANNNNILLVLTQGLDYVIAEAKKRGVHLILSLVNNWDGYGGKKQYVQWAREQGHFLNSDDDFFTNSVTKGFYENHVKAVLTRVNKFTGVAYKDDPTIFAWELMNEPRCQSDLSGKTLQAWIAEMAGYVKSVDPNHMVEIGLEGFYGESTPDQKQQFNPGGYTVGTDFISNNLIPSIDFATIHSYPDQWVPGASNDAHVAFMRRWMASHAGDAAAALRKPLLVAEFGWSARSNSYTVSMRDAYFGMVYDTIYSSARAGGPLAGGLFWQVMEPGMEGWTDGYDVVLGRSPSTAAVVGRECARITSLNQVF
ncbi:putative mannan endo-1,4-beta-mannosidase 9 [Dichanthelium oligosanthes]|uniref:mannan endo-1,4-beta-mannosidase n=1 Tax=Dichanthelium oligosanthes TaxID=888268 RepID=A0A1E5VDH7_9POAL|nr:putative mannan endo-1,4-beta-mannosidase 9 [Dichanthelium oligosanthes]